FAKRGSEETYPERNAINVAGRHLNDRISGRSGQTRGSENEFIAIQQIGRPCRVVRGGKHCVQLELLDRCVDAVYAGIMVDLQRLVIRKPEVRIDRVRIEADALRELEDVLVKERHLDVGMRIIEIDGGL